MLLGHFRENGPQASIAIVMPFFPQLRHSTLLESEQGRGLIGGLGLAFLQLCLAGDFDQSDQPSSRSS